MDVLRAMEVFVRVVDEGSLTAAAAKCGISPTMVGNRLHQLEERLGASLLHRTTRRQRLTEFGKHYYDRCLSILGSVADADALAQQAQGMPRGQLRVVAPPCFGAERLMPAMVEYLARYPAVELAVVLSSTIPDLVEDGFDAVIRVGALPDSRLIARPLGAYRMMMCAAPSYLARKGRPVSPEELRAHECLTFLACRRSGGCDQRAVWRMTGPSGSISIRVTGHLQADSTQALRRVALSGLGIALLPEVLVSEDVSAGRLVRLLGDYELASEPMHILYLPDRRTSPKLRSFVDFVVEKFGPGSHVEKGKATTRRESRVGADPYRPMRAARERVAG